MECKELINRMMIPVKPQFNDEELIKLEESNLTEVISNVCLLILILVYSKEY
jgi:hypothetical protein